MSEGLSQRLEKYESQAEWWQYGWLGFHSVATLANGYEAGRTHNSANKRYFTVNATTGGAAVLDMLVFPLYPNSVPKTFSGESEKQRNLYRLQELANKVKERSSWEAHLTGWLVGLVGGAIITAGPGKSSDGGMFFLSSGLVTELQIWTLPKEAVTEWESYQQTGKLSSVLPWDERKVSWKPAGASLDPHGLAVHWWFE
ncbi:hypothetical protein [Parendozoicomonas haliclonae]|nr:hypothetical protein [Parendozoicomonas haliclonae]